MRFTASIMILGLTASSVAVAQTSNPAPSTTTIAPATGQAPLSQDLSHSGGVVHPTATVDPGMSKTPPDPGPQSTPVITPKPNSSTVIPK